MGLKPSGEAHMYQSRKSHLIKIAILASVCATFILSDAHAAALQCADLFPAKKFDGVELDLIREMQSRHQTKQEKMLQILTTSQGLESLGAARGVLEKHDFDFTFELPEKPVRGDQAHTGDCYIQAPFNAIEEVAMNEGLIFTDQTLSRKNMLFYTYLEKSGKHLDKIISLRQNSERINNQTILKNIIPKIMDGGYADEVFALIEKYGVVFESAYPENANSRDSSAILSELNKYLLPKSYELWNLAESFDLKTKALHARVLSGQDKVDLERLTNEQIDILKAKRREILGGVFLVLEKAFGRPPVDFQAQIPVAGAPRGQQASAMVKINPKQLADYLKINPSDWVNVSNLRNLPRKAVYQTKFQDMTIPLRRLNLGSNRMKAIIKASLLAGVRVPFDSNFGPGVNVLTGDMALGTDSTDGVYPWNRLQAPRKLSPSEMAMLNITTANHQTQFTGFQQSLGKTLPEAFKVENQWGSRVGNDGNFKMYEDWFNLYVDGIMIHRSFLTPQERAIYDGQAVILPAINE